jgi:protein BCP1
MQEFINVDFEFFDPKPTDYHGVRALLKSYLDDEEFDLPGLVNLILAQTTVGSVIKTTEDDNPIGLLSVLGLERYKVRRYLVGVPPSWHSAAVLMLSSAFDHFCCQ